MASKWKYREWPRFGFYPSFRILILFLIGNACPFLITIEWFVAILLILICVLHTNFYYYHFRREAKEDYFLRWNLSYLLISIFLGYFWASIHLIDNKLAIGTSYQNLPKQFDWHESQVNGTILSLEKSQSGYFFNLDIQSIYDPILGSKAVEIPFTVKVYCAGYLIPTYQKEYFYRGARFNGIIQFFPFSEEKQAQSARVTTVLDMSSNSGFYGRISKTRQKLANQIEFLFSNNVSGLIKAILIGDKSTLKKEQKEVFAQLGLSHLLAVSGLHVGLIILPFWWLIGRSELKRKKPALALIGVLCILTLFCCLTAFQASVMRASFMASLFISGQLFNRFYRPLNMLCVSAFVMLLIKQEWLMDVGFQLSCMAVASIVLVIIPLQKWHLQKFGYKPWFNWLIWPMLMTLIIQLALIPFSAAYFGSFSLIAPIVNMLMLPLFSYIIYPLANLITLFSFLWFDVARYLAFVYSVCLEWVLFFLSEIGTISQSVELEKPDLWYWTMWLSFFAFVSVWWHKKLRWKALNCFLVVSLLAVIFSSTKTNYEEFDITQVHLQTEQKYVGEEIKRHHFLIRAFEQIEESWVLTQTEDKSIVLKKLYPDSLVYHLYKK